MEFKYSYLLFLLINTICGKRLGSYTGQIRHWKAFKITKKSSATYSSVDWSGLTPKIGR